MTDISDQFSPPKNKLAKSLFTGQITKDIKLHLSLNATQIRRKQEKEKNMAQSLNIQNETRKQILDSIQNAAQNQVVQEAPDRKVKHKLSDNEELVEYTVIDGKRKKKCIRHVRKKKDVTIEECNEILKVFKLFDKDNSGNIDSSELKDAMRALGIYVSKENNISLMEKADKDGSGTIEQPEFLSLMAELIEKRNPKGEVEKAFRMYDDDDGGTIDLSNLRRVVRELGYEDKVTDMDCLAMVKIADTKNQNAVDFEDFMNVMMKAGLF